MAEKIRPVEQMLELSEDEANSTEHLDSQVQKAQEQLLQLNANWRNSAVARTNWSTVARKWLIN